MVLLLFKIWGKKKVQIISKIIPKSISFFKNFHYLRETFLETRRTKLTFHKGVANQESSSLVLLFLLLNFFFLIFGEHLRNYPKLYFPCHFTKIKITQDHILSQQIIFLLSFKQTKKIILAVEGLIRYFFHHSKHSNISTDGT